MQHWLLPRVVDGPGSYLTRGGEVVTVERITNGFGYNNRAEGHYSNGIAEAWSCRGGRVLPFSLSQNDIVARA
jgi:hypothetical protein